MRISRGAIILETQRRYFYLRAWFWTLYTMLLNHFDPPPKRKKHETVPNYVLRLDKRYALRELNRAIGVIHSYDIGGINYMLSRKLDMQGREFFEYLKNRSEEKNSYIFLREQIRNSAE